MKDVSSAGIGVGLVLGLLVWAALRSCGDPPSAVDITYDTLVAHVEKLQVDSAARARVDSVTQSRIVTLENTLRQTRATATREAARADSLEQAFRFTLPDTLVAAFDSVTAAHNTEVMTLRRALAISDSLLDLERSRRMAAEAGLAATRATLREALAQVEAERHERSLWKQAKRAAPWLVATYALGRSGVP